MRDKEMPFDLAFDVVVVGAGSAGCVVASRLSERADLKVCLLEAGGLDRNIWFHIPMGFGKTIVNPNYTWGYKSEPDSGIAGRSISWVRGKVLGGSGSINGLVFLRGAAADYDAWSEFGVRGWTYREVLPYFKKMERTAVGNDEDHGRSGPIAITTNPRPSYTAKAFVQACENLQYARNDDFNAGKLDGVGLVPINVNGRWRHSTATAYLKPNLRRPNLKLMTSASVSKIIFDKKRAIGIEAVVDGKTLRIAARKELVLSGGAINSVTLLLRSGIGPANDLKALSIDVVSDLRGVGKNLQDHLNAGLAFRTSVKDSVNVALTSYWKSAGLMANWMLTKSGPIAGGAVEASLFAKTDPSLQTPDLQFHMMNFSRDLATGQPHSDPGCTLIFNVCRPKSRGEIRLKNPETLEPAIIPNYFSDPDDMDRMVKGFGIACRIAEAPPFNGLIVERVRPASAQLSREDIVDFIRKSAMTTYHPCGTCRMGEDEGAVVDSRLRVKGVDGLRVVDASVIPSIPSPNIHPATIMIAEKGADMICADTR